ncbi:MAG TPA: 5'-nucleotidase C-terminal domain-containing protein [Methylomirabilota bacterium]
MRLRLALVLLVLAACARPDAVNDVRRITIVDFSDWHGQLEPVQVTRGGGRRALGGAAALKAYVDRERERNPGGTLVVTAGDAVGATPPLSSFLDDVPAIEVLNAMGLDIDTLGNHNFDRGIDHLRRLVAVAKFPYVAANIVGPDGQTLVPPTHVFARNGVRVGVIGIGNPETPAVVARDRVKGWQFLDPARVITAHAATLRQNGAHLVIVLAHIGATAVAADGAPGGVLGDVARAIRGVDVLIGDHTGVPVNARIGQTLVIANRSRGLQFAVVDLEYDLAQRKLARASAVHRTPFVDEIVPDAALEAQIQGYRAAVRPLLDHALGEAAFLVSRAGARESALGNFVADTLRATYGTQLAFINSGGIRDNLPADYRPGDQALRRPMPGYAPGPPWDVVRGDILAALPFNNVAVTFKITGRTLWQALENSVAPGVIVDGRFATDSGRFLQVSGFAFRFDPRQTSGQRVTHVRLADGSPIAPDGREYTAVTVDFMYDGGDGYTMLNNGTGTTREPYSEVLAQALRVRPVAARVEGRIHIEGE